MKKFSKAFVCLTLCAASLASATGCREKTGGIVNDPQTINVKIHSAGYGTDYIYRFKQEFEEIYAEEGYKVNVVKPDPDLANQNVYKDIYGNSGVDVYIASAEAQASANYIGTQSFADITESVVAQTPIGKNKQEGGASIASYIEGSENDESYRYNGIYYGIPVALSVGGLGVNTKVLKDKFGIEQLPRTTNEMFAIVDKIQKQAAIEINDGGDYMDVVHPFSYSLKGNQYWMVLANSWFRQYSGAEAYDKFWSFENNGTAMTEDCYTVFADDGLKEMMNLLFQVYDYNACVTNVSSDFLKAQHNVVLGDAIFCPTGDWMLNEEMRLYKDKLGDIDFIKTPLISALGTKLFGTGTSYAFSDERCEELLIKIVDGADANKTVAEIKASLPAEFASVSEEDITTVCESRGAYRDSSGTSAYISQKSTKKDIAVAFLRYIASEDGALAFSQTANTTSPYSAGKLDGSKYPWLDSVNKITTNAYASKIVTKATGYRKQLGVVEMFYQKGALASLLYNEEKTIYDEDTLRVISGMSRASYKAWSDAYMDGIFKNAQDCVENKIWK